MAKLEIWTFDANPERRIARPIRTSCDAEKFGYPNVDDEGRAMFVNTHFRTEAEAWERLIAEVVAIERTFASRYRQAQQRLSEATEELAAAAAFSSEVRAAHRESR